MKARVALRQKAYRHAGWLVTGREVPSWANRVLSAPLAAFVIALLAFVVGLYGSLYATEIRQSTERVFSAPRGTTDWKTVGFWVSGFLWALLFYMRLIAEADEKRRLERAIHRCPNPHVLRGYRSTFEGVVSSLQVTEAAPTTEAGLKQMADGLRGALKHLMAFAREFSDPTPGAPRGCNIMLVYTGEFPESLVARLRFISEGHDPARLRAILDIPPELIVSTSPELHVTPIALPVPRKPKGKFGNEQALPGGPSALLTGMLSVHADSRKLALQCDYLDAGIREELRRYFSATGDGANVRSFASVRIGTDQEPVGVVNFDYSEVGLLGEEEYYGTFRALLLPMLHALRAPLARYTRLKLSLGEPP